jgi:lipid-A-disaccharide synthase
MQKNNIFISAGEASGDLHAANLVKEIKSTNPEIKFFGMGGSLMRESGVEILFDFTRLAIVGGTEILFHFKKILRAMSIAKQFLKNNPPNLVILIDYPGFNLWLAQKAKKLNIKVLYYISPQVWAWHKSRIHRIKKYVDFMAVVLPFEVALYEKAGIPAAFVGHPLLKVVHPTMDIHEAKKCFNIKEDDKVVGLFPGSRIAEIKRLLPSMLQTAELLQNKYPNIQFIIPLASSLQENDLEPYLIDTNLNINIVKNKNYDVISICDAIIATSGTVTLEIALLAVPMVIVYKMSSINYFFAKRLVKIPFIGLCNIIANEKIVEELIQNEASAKNIFSAIDKILQNENYRMEMIGKLQQIKSKLASVEQKNIKDIVLQLMLEKK